MLLLCLGIQQFMYDKIMNDLIFPKIRGEEEIDKAGEEKKLHIN